MFLNTITPGRSAPVLPIFDMKLPALPDIPKILPINLSPKEIRDMVLEVMG